MLCNTMDCRVWGRTKYTLRRLMDELWKGVVSALTLFLVASALNVIANLRVGLDLIAAVGLAVFVLITIPILIGNRRRLPFGLGRKKDGETDEGDAMATGIWTYVKVDGATKRLFPRDPDLVIARWWPEKVKVRADFVATDTTRMSVRVVRSSAKIEPETASPTGASERWSMPSGRSFTKEFDTEAGGWVFGATRPKPKVFNPEVKVEA